MKLETIILGLGLIGIAAYALMQKPTVVKDPVFVDRPFLVEIPTALITPQPNVYSFYNVDAAMHPGAVAIAAPTSSLETTREGLGGSTPAEWDAWVSQQYAAEVGD